MTSVVYDFDDIRSRRPGAEPTWSMEQGARPLEGARDTIGPAVEADLCATGGRLRRGDPCQANMSAKRELRALFGAAAPDSSDGTGKMRRGERAWVVLSAPPTAEPGMRPDDLAAPL
jgi:hypothetical protein